MERDLIIKALGICSTTGDCPNCSYNDDTSLCINRIIKDALSLIKELTEENERLENVNKALKRLYLNTHKENDAWQKELIRQKELADKHYYELACEVEDLRAIAEQYQKQFEDAKADTVRKMQERLVAEFRKDDRMNYYLRMTLDRIVKEMLEGDNGCVS